MIVSYYHVTYTFQSESTLYSGLNFKKHFAQNRRDIWSLSDSNGIESRFTLNTRFWVKRDNNILCFIIITYSQTWHDNNIDSNGPYRQVLKTQPNNCETIGFMVSNCCEKKQTNTFGTLVIKEIMISQI